MCILSKPNSHLKAFHKIIWNILCFLLLAPNTALNLLIFPALLILNTWKIHILVQIYNKDFTIPTNTKYFNYKLLCSMWNTTSIQPIQDASVFYFFFCFQIIVWKHKINFILIVCLTETNKDIWSSNFSYEINVA